MCAKFGSYKWWQGHVFQLVELLRCSGAIKWQQQKFSRKYTAHFSLVNLDKSNAGSSLQEVVDLSMALNLCTTSSSYSLTMYLITVLHAGSDCFFWFSI